MVINLWELKGRGSGVIRELTSGGKKKKIRFAVKCGEFLVCACCCSMHSHTSMLIKLHLQKLQLDSVLK